MRPAISILLLFMLALTSAWAQVQRYSFQQLKEEQGLAQNFAYGLSQDERGFLWIGTGVGLSRYDGYEIKNFTVHDSLSADFVTAALRTRSGGLILGHNQGGVTFFDGIRFHVLLADTLQNKVVGIAEDARDEFWIATQSKGILRVSRKNATVERLMPDALQGQVVNALYLQGNRLWIGTNEGLLFFRHQGRKLTQEQHNALPEYVSVNAILQDRTDSTRVWIGTGFRGLHLLQETGGGQIAKRFDFQLPDFSSDIIQALAQDVSGDLWIGTRQHGVVHLNIGRDGRSIFRTSYFGRQTGFPLSSVNQLLIDHQGQIWASTMGDGVIKIYKELFDYFPFAEQFGVSNVRAIAETAFGYLLATDVGLLQITRNVQSDEYEVKRVNALDDEPILTVFTDSQQRTWIGTETQGVFQFKDDIEHLQPMVIDPPNEPLEVRLFEEDNKRNIWMSARAQGLYTLNSANKVIRHLTTANRFIHNDVFAIKADSKGNMWFGTYGAGLAMLDKTGALQLFSKKDSLQARDINDIDEDSAGNIWIATEGDGFFKYDGHNFIQVGSSANLVSPFIKGIQFDPTGRVWFSYRKGLGYYDIQSDKKHHFDRRDGLLVNEAYSSSIIVDSKSNKWFCNDYGITLFEHDTIAEARRDLATYLTNVRVFYKHHPADLRLGEVSESQAPQLQLTHEQNHITFDFVAVKLHGSSKIYYRHFLEGYDSDWTPPETANFVTYTNLDPGSYVLRVQATDDPGSWVDPVTEYSFEITPPYWKRTWFYLLQIVSVLTLFFLTWFIGKKGISTKRYVLRLMLFSSFFITLEYVENFVDPLVSDFFGGAPVFRFFLNFLLALLLLPVETLITHWLMESKMNKRQSEAVVDQPALQEDEIEQGRI